MVYSQENLDMKFNGIRGRIPRCKSAAQGNPRPKNPVLDPRRSTEDQGTDVLEEHF